MGGALTARCGLFSPAAASSYVTSVQYVSITIPALATSATATISAVSTTRSFLIHNGLTTAGNLTRDTLWGRVELTNSTTITAFRNSASVEAITINACLVEGTSLLVDNVQYGTITTTNSSVNAAVTSVTTGQSACFWLGCTTTSASGPAAQDMALYHGTFVDLTSATTVNTTDDSFGGTRTTGFCLVQFASGALQSLQRIIDDYSDASTTNSKTISSVNVNNTLIAWGGQTQDTSNNTNIYYGQLTSATNVNLVRSSTSATSRKPRYTVVEFKSAVINTAAQRGNISLNNVTSNTATLSPTIPTTKAVLNRVGLTAPAVDFNSASQKLELTSSSTVTATVNTASVSTVRQIGWECRAFN